MAARSTPTCVEDDLILTDEMWRFLGAPPRAWGRLLDLDGVGADFGAPPHAWRRQVLNGLRERDHRSTPRA
ncbi:hypothetical protein GCM10010399_80120 [Dactylosporangium fulvum]